LSQKTFHLFDGPPTFDPDTLEPWEDPAHLDTVTAENAEAVAWSLSEPEVFDQEEHYWLLEAGAHPDDAQEWTIVQHAPLIEVRRV